MTVAAPAPQVG